MEVEYKEILQVVAFGLVLVGALIGLVNLYNLVNSESPLEFNQTNNTITTIPELTEQEVFCFRTKFYNDSNVLDMYDLEANEENLLTLELIKTEFCKEVLTK